MSRQEAHKPEPGNFAALFARAGLYPGRAGQGPGQVREALETGQVFAFSERHIQCLWFDGGHRPPALRTRHGEAVEVLDPGRWNREAGPDFLDAALLAGPERRRLEGDIEVHVRPRDWEQHGHGRQAAYRRVVAHVTWFPGPRPVSLPPAALQIPLRDAAQATPGCALETIDVTAYPYAAMPLGMELPCRQRLLGWGPDRRGALLDAAGEERLRLKTVRLAGAIREQGREQVFYEEVLSALGYKHNRAACRRLADLLPVDALRDGSGGRPVTAYALLLGVAGLLPREPPPGADAATVRFLRDLWGHWWRAGEAWHARAMRRDAWRLAGLRPQNHPARRLAAAAGLFSRGPGPAAGIAALDTGVPDRWLAAVRAALTPRRAPPYWGRRLAWGRPPLEANVALLGAARLNAIIVNVAVPFAATSGRPVAPLLRALPRGDTHAIIRETAHRLFGPDHNPALYADGLRRQGMVQIFHDFCLASAVPCSHCPLPAALDAATG